MITVAVILSLLLLLVSTDPDQGDLQNS